jgi:hypothetical protein
MVARFMSIRDLWSFEPDEVALLSKRTSDDLGNGILLPETGMRLDRNVEDLLAERGLGRSGEAYDTHTVLTAFIPCVDTPR